MDNELLDSNKNELDINETNIRPDCLNEYIGQSEVKENIDIFSIDLSNEIINDFSKEFNNIDTDIMMPSLWVRK